MWRVLSHGFFALSLFAGQGPCCLPAAAGAIAPGLIDHHAAAHQEHIAISHNRHRGAPADLPCCSSHSKTESIPGCAACATVQAADYEAPAAPLTAAKPAFLPPSLAASITAAAFVSVAYGVPPPPLKSRDRYRLFARPRE